MIAPATVAPIAVPGGVSEPSHRLLFVSGAEGGIDAVELRTGRLVWQTSAALRPILAVGDRLVTTEALERTSGFRVVVLDAASGSRISTSEPVNFPYGVYELTDVTLKGGLLSLAWSSYNEYRAPVPMPDDQAAEYQRGARGVAAVRLETGEVEILPAPAGSPDGRPPLPEAWRDAEILSAISGEPAVWVSGDRLAALVLEPRDEGVALALYTCEVASGELPRSHELLARAPDGNYLQYHPTEDKARVVLLVCKDSDRQGLPPQTSCSWTIFSTATGELTSSLPYEDGSEPPRILNDSTLLYLTTAAGPVYQADETVLPRTLTAIDASSGETLWRRPIRPELAPSDAH